MRRQEGRQNATKVSTPLFNKKNARNLKQSGINHGGKNVGGYFKKLTNKHAHTRDAATNRVDHPSGWGQT